MESRRQGPPAVYTPTGRDHSTVQGPPNIYKPPQASARIRTDYNTQRAPLKSPYSPSFEPEYNSNTVSSWLPDKEQQQRNGRVTTNPHRKRDSQGNEQQAMSYVPSPDVLPAAPDVPRAPPPISYRDPYANGAPPAPYQGSSRSFSARARALQLAAYSPPTTALSDDFARSGEQQTTRQRRSSASNSSTIGYSQSQPAVPPSYSSSSTYAAIPLQHSEIASPKQNGTATSPLSRSNTRKESEASTATVDPRKNWASDRSPLQKLEGKLNDISKEEKRARVEEAEQLLRESKAGTGDRRPDRRDAPPPGRAQSRRVSGAARHRSEEAMLTTDQNSGKQILRARVASEGGRTTETDRSTLQARDESEYRHQQYSQKQNTYTKNGADRSTGTQDRLNSQYQQQLRTPEIAGYRPPLANDRERSVKFQDQQNQAKPFGNETRPDDGPPEQRGTLYDRTALTTTDRSSGDSAADIPGRGSSRRFHKEQSRSQKPATGDRSSKVVPQEQRQLYTNRIEPSKMGESAASHGGIPDPVPGHAVRNPRGHVPRYEVPPQTAGAQQARQQVGFGNRDNGDVGIVPDRKHHVSNLLHPGRRDPSMSHETPRTAPGRLDEWRMGGTARLTARDFVIDTDEAATKKAWWEGGQSGSQRENGRVRQDYGKGSPLVGGYEEEHAGPTSFRPPLYLKCGPLLRYTGLKRERVTRTSNRGGSHTTERELWRGSVMIVTVDSDSTYEAAPRLRLFAQPMDLLPAPPQQLDSERGEQFAPEYIDPIAGLPKISRTGKTVYVKPVEHLAEEVDFSRIEDNRGLFEEFPDPAFANNAARDGGLDDAPTSPFPKSRVKDQNSEKMGKFQEVKGIRLHAEKGVTFWRFNLEVELNTTQKCIAYRINRGPAIKFWVPARGQTMNVMFHSCNGFSISVNASNFSGPDPLWRDVLGAHQTRPFHVMIGGGDQIYNDAVTQQTTLFREWLSIKNPHHKHSTPFSAEMREELETFYLERYSMWFSQGLFGMANSQIPMINIWDDHDIIDGFGSYPHHFMSSPVFTGLGAVAFKYYMLFQHQSVPDEAQADEPSWLLGAAPGPYINELSRSVFMSLGRKVALLGLDCRTERMRDEILSEKSYNAIFDRCRQEVVAGETKHLIVLLGVPIAYPRLVWLENVLTSRLMDPIKALGRAGMLGGFLNQFDGGVEILDDLDDHWTAKNHKAERNWFIEELQELAAEKSIRVTILGGDVHLAAVGQFYSNPKLKVAKDRDHRYMPNVISSAIVNTPPPELLGDILNKRNRTHHFDKETDEDMIPMFAHDIDGKPRNNKCLLPRRNWCSIREYHPGTTPPPTPPTPEDWTPEQQPRPPGKLQRTLSMSRKDILPSNLLRRLSQRDAPPDTGADGHRTPGPDMVSHPTPGSANGYFPPQPQSPRHQHTTLGINGDGATPAVRPGGFHRRPTNLSVKAAKRGGADEADQSGHINLEGGLDIVLNCEVSQKDPAGITVPYRLLVPALFYEGDGDLNTANLKRGTWLSRLSKGSHKNTGLANRQGDGEWGGESSESDGQAVGYENEQHERPRSGPYGQGGGYSGVEAYKEKGRRRWF